MQDGENKLLHKGSLYGRDDWQLTAFQRFVSLMQKAGADSFRPVSRILDLGCGNGKVTRFLASLFPQAEILAVDRDEQMLETARTAAADSRIRYVQKDIVELDRLLKDEAQPFDLVNANYVLHWLNLEQKTKLFSFLPDAMSVGSMLWIGTCQAFPQYLQFIDARIRRYLKREKEKPYDFIHYLDYDQWELFLRSNGFAISAAYEGLDPHPIAVSEQMTDSQNFLSSWLWGASTGRAAYGQKPEAFSAAFVEDLFRTTVEHYGSRQYYDFKAGGRKTPVPSGRSAAAFLEETLLILGVRK